MATRIIVGLIVLVALIQGLATVDSKGILPLALVVLGLIYAAVAVDAEDATGYPWLLLLQSALPRKRTC